MENIFETLFIQESLNILNELALEARVLQEQNEVCITINLSLSCKRLIYHGNGKEIAI